MISSGNRLRGALLASLLLGCGTSAQSPPEPTPPTEASAEDPMEIKGAIGNAPNDEESADRVAARHVLVSYQGAESAPSTIRRTHAEARQRAGEIRKRLMAGEDMAALAKEMSDCPSGRRGGFLGGFGPGAMDERFERAAFALKVGQISDVVETPFGFHVIRREELEEAQVNHIIVRWASIPGSRATGTRDEARARIEEARDRIARGDDFKQVAHDISDGSLASFGGDLGTFTRGQFLPAFEDAVFAIKPGHTSDIFETPAGFHIVQRVR